MIADPSTRGGLPEPGRAVGAGHVAGQQPAQGDADRHPHAGERDPAAEHAERAALHAGDVDAHAFLDGHGGQSGPVAAHRPMDRPMISFMISVVPP